MEILASRVLLHPSDLERSLRFYGETLGLSVYREFGAGSSRGVVFFLGGGFLELSRGGSGAAPTDALELWLQVPELGTVHRALQQAGAAIEEPPAEMPWGLREMRVLDPDGLRLVFVEVPPDHPLRRDPRVDS